MTTTFRRRSLLLLLLAAVGGLLSACGGAPIHVALQDVTIDLGAIGSSQGQVLYPAGGSSFQRPDLHVRSAAVDGDVSASGLSSATTFTFYGRASDPSADPNCQPVSNLTTTFYACPEGQEAAISDPVTLPADGSSRPIHLSGPVLATAANQGRLWIGATVQGGASVNATLHFTHLDASVTLF